MDEYFFYNPNEPKIVKEMIEEARKILVHNAPFSSAWERAVRIQTEAEKIERKIKCRVAHGKK
jgi:hypothetical protein